MCKAAIGWRPKLAGWRGLGAHRPITLSQNNLNKSRTARPAARSLPLPMKYLRSVLRLRADAETSAKQQARGGGRWSLGRLGAAGWQLGGVPRRAEREPSRAEARRMPGCQDVAGVWKCRRKSTTTHTHGEHNYANRACGGERDGRRARSHRSASVSASERGRVSKDDLLTEGQVWTDSQAHPPTSGTLIRGAKKQSAPLKPSWQDTRRAPSALARPDEPAECGCNDLKGF
ncbi:GM19149 [Drosophila sechellia]|uniref:GM19149 n=1 Tax=Drosophila sechellia TaxID=7238 RepID=B4I9G2_DROSE|nr:GM19149 [Drosophila sechellia]